jgi:hypothetical protein
LGNAHVLSQTACVLLTIVYMLINKCIIFASGRVWDLFYFIGSGMAKMRHKPYPKEF